MRHFSNGYDDDDWDPDVDFMYQAGRAMQEEERYTPVSVSSPANNVAPTHPGIWRLFRTMVSKRWQDSYVQDVFSDVVVRYTEDHRAYHNLSHLEDLASQFEFNQHLLTKPQAQAVRAALVLHDVVYECAPGADEKASSEYAGNFLAMLGTNDRIIRKAQKIILATADHKAAADDFPTRLFLDMDMSILASRPDVYAGWYLPGVRFEFCTKLSLTSEQFDKARAERFLKPTLESPTPIFSTDQYRELEPLARSNMRKELDGCFSAKRARAFHR